LLVGATLAGMKKVGPLLLVWFFFLSTGFSQPTTATTASSAAAPAAEVVTLGNSVAALTGAWKFEPGDSPVVNGAPVWAQPGFDDSKWAKMDLTPKAGSVDPAYGTSGFVPGWTSQGFPKVDGYAWYRLRLRVSDPGQQLWLKMPNDVDDAYQVYANGQYVGQFGRFSPSGVAVYSARTASFPLPALKPGGDLELAVRFYMTSGTRFQSPDAGGMHQPPVLGLGPTVQLLQAAEDDANLHYYLGVILQSILYFVVAPLALWAWMKNREERGYFWLFLALAIAPARTAVLLLGNLASKMSLGAQGLLLAVVLDPFVLPLWIIFWWHWFGLRRQRWIPRVAWGLAGADMLAVLAVRSTAAGVDLVPRSWLPWFNSTSAVLLAALGLLLVVILIAGFRRDRTEALAAAVPILLLEVASFNTYLLRVGISTEFYPFGIGISTQAIASILMVLVIGVLALRRFVRTQVHESLARQAIRKDLEQAQQLQQRVLVPEAVESAVFKVEAEYRPAQTVGGDFFQTLTKPDGSLLVVIGDVSGKGVSAAMLVAVLVGTIRTRADESFDPASMLAMLNHRLIGRSGGHFATCLAAELSPDGQIRIANAGHLPPYLNGKEMELEGSLPLGLVEGSEVSVQAFALEPGDRLTFMTDGVVEAMNEAKELFGFERTRKISKQHAAAIAEQAQEFGQEDDITVVSVSFTGVAATVGVHV
jgi:Stage II sporulation protein E (SpoIIE)